MSSEPASRRAEAALRAQRLFAPAGDNAFELFLQAVAEQPGDERARNALQDLVPYAVLHVEQRLAARDRAEATRVLELLQGAQPDAPALPRLQRALQAMPAEAREPVAETAPSTDTRSRAVEAIGRPAPTSETPDLTTAPAPDAPSSDATRPADTDEPAPPADAAAHTVAEGASAEAIVSPTPAAVAPGPATGTAPPREDALPRVLRQVAPKYPPVAGRRRQEGEVEVAFTINPDGRVSDVSIVRSEPVRLFDRAAIAAMEDWRYEPPGRSIRSTRTFAFRVD